MSSRDRGVRRQKGGKGETIRGGRETALRFRWRSSFVSLQPPIYQLDRAPCRRDGERSHRCVRAVPGGLLLAPPWRPHRVLDRLILVTALGRPVRPVPYARFRLQIVPVDHAVRPFGHDGARVLFRLVHACLAMAEAHLPAVLGIGYGWSDPLPGRADGHVS